MYILDAESCDFKEPYIRKQIKIVLCLSVSTLMIGFSLGWSAPVIIKLQNIDETPLDHVITDVEATWLATCILISNLVVLNFSGQIVNVVGRKPYLIFLSAAMLLGYALITTATNITMLYAGRVISGFGTGSPNIRGAVTAANGIVHVLGCLLIYSIGPYLSFAEIGYTAMSIAAICIGCGLCLPESPVYHVNRGNTEKAKEILRKLGRSKEIDTELEIMIANRNNALKDSTSEMNGVLRNWTEMFTNKINRRSLAFTGTLFFLQMASGVVTVTFFATSIFKVAKSSIEPNICTILLGVTELCAVIYTSFLIDRFGRRLLLLFSSFGCVVTMGLLGVYFYLDSTQHQVLESLGWLPLLLLILFLLSFNSGLHIVPNTFLGEMFTPNVRSTGSCVSFSISLIGGWATSLLFGYLVTFGNYLTFWMFTFFNLVTFVYTILCVPETKGKSLTEIQDMLSK